MSHQFKPSFQLYWIQSIELKPTEQVRGKIYALLLVDGGVVHKLRLIKKGQPLFWRGPLFCNASPNSVIGIQIHEVHHFRMKPILKCTMELSVSQVESQCSFQFIELKGNVISVSLTSLNPLSISDTKPAPNRRSIEQGLRASQRASERLYRSSAAFKTILEFGSAVAELCPTTARTARAVCRSAWQELERKSGYADDIEELVVGFANSLGFVQLVGGLSYSIGLKATTVDILELIRKASESILNYSSVPKEGQLGTSFALATQAQRQDLLKQLRRLKENFDRRLNVQEHVDWMNEGLSKLELLAHSTYHGNSGCLPGTRTAIINDINQWIGQETGADRLLWMHGPSGIGKSSIAASICHLLETREALGASFFCKWDDPELCEPNIVLSAIIGGLARHVADYGDLVVSVINENPELHTLPIGVLYKRLVKVPLMTIASLDATLKPTCIVVDALDSCGAKAGRIELLSYLIGMSQLAPWLKVIVTSQFDGDIRGLLDRAPKSISKKVDLGQYDASKDISALLCERMAPKLGMSFQIDDLKLVSLTERAGGLFIWADVACRLILSSPNPYELFEEVLRIPNLNDASLKLDLLYSIVMKKATRDLNEADVPREWLGIIALTGLHMPLSVDSIEQLLGDPHCPSVLGALFKALNPVLYEDGSKYGKGFIRVYHQTFANYMITKSRSKDLYGGSVTQDALLSTCCLKIMLAELKFNMCELETLYVPNRNIPGLESRVASKIKPHLAYSCQYWINHVTATDPTHIDTSLLREHLFGRTLFYWIEALSLLKMLNIAVFKLPKLIEWTRKDPNLAGLWECIHDAYRFVLGFYDVISESAPHLYLSALPFAPTYSAIAQRGREWFPNTAKLIKGAVEDWPPCLQILPHSSSILSFALSPNGCMVATGSQDNTVQLWDLATGMLVLAPLVGHSDCVWSVAFSPNGCYVASGSHDKTVQIWDPETGGRVFEPLVGHSGPVLSVSFSCDGRRVVSGSHDKTVRIWNLENGGEASMSLVGHSGPVLSVQFSPEDCRIASGSFDKTVRIWDIKTGISASLIGHSGWVGSIRFSPDGQRVASSSSDKTIWIWDVKTGGKVYGPILGHSGLVNCVAYSPDGLRIISGSTDSTIRVWDAETGGPLALLEGHADFVVSVAVCSDSRAVSASRDHTVRIWDLETLARTGVRAPSGGRLSPKLSGPLPREGRHLVPGSGGRAVWTGDVSAGAVVPLTVVGHSGTVRSVAFSPNGQRIVSGSDDNTVRVWDANTGAEVSEPLIGHSAPVNSVAFSPDGRHIVSGSDDEMVRMWDSESGVQVSTPLVGHSGWVYSVAFSPDGRNIISGSDDDTVRMWDAGTGAEISSQRIEYPDPVVSVAFSPVGRRIVSCSSDHIVGMWDAESSTRLSTRLVGHSGIVWSVASGKTRGAS